MIQAIAARARSSPPSTVTSSRYRASASLWRFMRVSAHIVRAGSRPHSTVIFAAAPSCQVKHVAHHRRLEHECLPGALHAPTGGCPCLTGSRKSAAARSTLSSAVNARLSVRRSSRCVCSYYRYDGYVIRLLLAARCHGDACEWMCRSGTKFSCFRRRDSSSFVAGGQKVKLKKRELDRILQHFHIKVSAHSIPFAY